MRFVKNRSFNLLWAGNTLSVFGNRIYMVGIMWYVIQSTGSGLALGLSTVCFTLPALLFMMFSGKMADSNRKREILVGTDFFNGIIMLVIGLLIAQDTSISSLYMWMFISSSLTAFFNPTLSASIPLLVKRENLTQANASMNTTRQISNILGPAIGGILISQFGIAWVFYINALSYILSAILELFLNIPAIKEEDNNRFFQSIKKGWHILKSDGALLKLIFAGCFLINFFLAPLYIFITYLCGEVLNVGSKGLGIADAAISVGALLGSLFLLYFKQANMRNLAMIGLLLEGVALMVGGIWGSYPSLLTLTVLLGGGISLASIGISTLIQLITPPEFMGRISSVSGALSAISVPTGSLVGSLLISTFNIFHILIVYGVCVLASSLVFVNLKKEAHHVELPLANDQT